MSIKGQQHFSLECLVSVALRGLQTQQEQLAAVQAARRIPFVSDALNGVPDPAGEEHLKVIVSRLRTTLRRCLPNSVGGIVEALGLDAMQARVLLGVLAGLTVAKAVEEATRGTADVRDRTTGTRWMAKAAAQIATWILEQDDEPAGLAEYLRCHESRCAFIDPRGVRRTAHSEDLVLPLTDVYISVRLGPENPAEVTADFELATSELVGGSLQDHLLDDLLAFDEPEPLDGGQFSELLRDRRWLVVLGDPGAGKTTLLNWLALKSAQAIRNGENRVLVDGRRLGLPEEDVVDLGPTRLPVLLRVADYADALARCRAARAPLPDLYDFLGQHSVGNEPLPGNPQANAALIRRYLDAGEALILADGLDEITDLTLRRLIATKLDNFAHQHVPDPAEPAAYLPTPDDESTWWTTRPVLPPSAGGNQMIVTSRIAGYKEASLRGAAATAKLQPLDDEAIHRFIADWCLAVERARARTVPTPDGEIVARAEQASRALADGIFAEPRTRRLATNPLLLTVLALLQRERGRMPTRRVELYEEATRVLVERRLALDMEFDEVTDVLGPFALWLQEHSNTGYASEEELRGSIRGALGRVTEVVRESEVDDFVRSAREQAGLLAEVGVGRYGFLHATFREYLAAREATRSNDAFDALICRSLHVPRWTEVLLLGAAIVAKERAQDADRVLELILNRSSPLEDLLHRDLVFAASCLNEMTRVTPALAGKIVSKLFDVAALAERSDFETLRIRTTEELDHLAEGKPRVVIPRLIEVLRAGNASRAAVLVAGRQRPTLELLDALEMACRGPGHDIAAFEARANAASALLDTGELTDSGYLPVGTLCAQHADTLAGLAPHHPLVAALTAAEAIVCPPLREALRAVLLSGRPAIVDEANAGAAIRAELIDRMAASCGADFLVMFRFAAGMSRADAADWLRGSYAAGELDMASAARCIAYHPWALPASTEQLRTWFAALPEAAQTTLLEYQSFAGQASRLEVVVWRHVSQDGALGDSAREFLRRRAVMVDGLLATHESLHRASRHADRPANQPQIARAGPGPPTAPYAWPVGRRSLGDRRGAPARPVLTAGGHPRG